MQAEPRRHVTLCRDVRCLGNGAIHSQRDQCEEGQVLAVVVPLGHVRPLYEMIIIPLMSSSFQRSHNVASDEKTH